MTRKWVEAQGHLKKETKDRQVSGLQLDEVGTGCTLYKAREVCRLLDFNATSQTTRVSFVVTVFLCS